MFLKSLVFRYAHAITNSMKLILLAATLFFFNTLFPFAKAQAQQPNTSITSPVAATKDYVEREVTFQTYDSLQLYGTLTTPLMRDPNVRWPLVIMVHGSGPQDRNESNIEFRFDTNFSKSNYNWSTI